MANAIFLKLEGMEGECTDDAHDKEINVIDFSWGATNPTTMASGQGVSAGKVMLQQLNISKIIDTTSHTFVQKCCSGKVIPSGSLFVQRAGGEKVQALEIKLTNIYVSNYTISDMTSNVSSLPTESVSLSYEQVEFFYKKQKEDGTEEASKDANWNVKTNSEAK